MRSPPDKENRTLAGPVQFAGAEPAITFQRGTAASVGACHLGEEQAIVDSESEYAHAPLACNAEPRMPAMQARNAAQMRLRRARRSYASR
jgi:hypothetical protein